MNPKAYCNLLTAGFVSMIVSGFILLFQGELLLMFGALIMALVCYDELAKAKES